VELKLVLRFWAEIGSAPGGSVSVRYVSVGSIAGDPVSEGCCTDLSGADASKGWTQNWVGCRIGSYRCICMLGIGPGGKWLGRT